MLTPASLEIVNATVDVVRENGLAITDCFYKKLLRAHPELTQLFNMSNQNSGEQKQALASAVYAYAANQNHPERLEPVLNRIAHKHASLGILPTQYTIVGKHLMAAIGEVLGDAVTAEVAAAWDEVYWQLACDLIAREARLYEGRDIQDLDAYWQWMKITDIHEESPLVKSFYLINDNNEPLPQFAPGQYISVALQDGESRQVRQYSLSNTPDQLALRITVKRELGAANHRPNGWLSNRLHQLNIGDYLQVGRPYGDFVDAAPSAPLVLISAGVGITPMVSIWAQRAKDKNTLPIHFIHGCANAEEIPLMDEVMAAASKLTNGRVSIFAETSAASGLDCIAGQVDLAKVLTEPEPGARYLLCGGIPFMRAVRAQLLVMNIDPTRIHYEVFGPDLFAGLD